MEFLRDKDGKNYFMEINFRNDGNSISVTEAGVNLHYLWYAFNTSLDLETESYHISKEVYVMPEFTELSLWFTGSISLFRFIKEMIQADVFMDYAKDDPAPTDGMSRWGKELMLSLVLKPLVTIKHKLFRK